MELHNQNPLKVNGANFYILLYEIFRTSLGKRVRLVAACRSFVNSPVDIRIEILTDIPQMVYIEQARDYMQTFRARTVFETTMPEAAKFFCEKHIAEATELLYNLINDKTPEGLYIDYSFSF